MKKIITITMLLLLCAVHSFAALKSETVEYKQGDVVLEGYLVYDDAVTTPRPGIVVVHDWMGFGSYGNGRADMLAELGYVALAIDIYGKGVRPKNTDEAAQLAGKYKSDRALMRARALAGLDYLKSNPLVDPTKLGAIGYCFGGTVALEMARAGADLAGVVSFHGGLSTPNPDATKNIKPRILALHGAEDPFVLPSEVEGFENEMRAAGADWQLVAYGGAVHSFTRPDAGDDKSKGVAYNEKADKRSWEAMKTFFKDVFGQ